MAQVGDIVRYLDSVGGGEIVRIEGNLAYVDDDGFTTPVLLKQCVVVTKASTHSSLPSKEINPVKLSEPKPAVSATVESQEVPGSDTLNVVLAFEPDNIKQLSSCDYTALLVNDSNYRLMATFMTRPNSGDWVARWSGILEPNMVEPIVTVNRDDLAEIDKIAVQLIAYKQSKTFRLKAPASVELSLDTTKFFKLHCFRTTEYFDTPVLSFDIIRNDVAYRMTQIPVQSLQRAMTEKKNVEARKNSVPSVKKQRHSEGPIEVDLHIGQLLDNMTGLSNADMLEVQMSEFRRVMQRFSKDKGRKIVFIHGKGEGVLRQALLRELKNKYKNCSAQDASFREYGFGATQVTIG